MLAAGNGWRWGQWCWRCWGSGSGSDHPGKEGAHWGFEGMDQQLAWQMGHLPVFGVSVCVCVRTEGRRQEERARVMWGERKMRSNSYKYVCVCVFVCMQVGWKRLNKPQINKVEKNKKPDGHRQTHTPINISGDREGDE